MARTIGVEIVGDASSVNRAFGSASRSAQSFDRSIGHSIRGATAGAGVFRSLGRSLAFASGGFLAFAGAASTLRDSIVGAETLKKAQESLDVAIQHTGGSLTRLVPAYTAVAKGAQQFGINQADATSALARATVLTGNAVRAQRAYQEAIVISKATGKDFNFVLTATAKGQEGVTTSLQRYGILLKKGTPSQQQFNMVMARFSGQAKANTSQIDRFNATWQNTEAILGSAILPILNRLLSRFGNWLQKLDESGRLQRDVNGALQDGKKVFDAIGSAIKGVDQVTGSFKNTLEALLTLGVIAKLSRWTGALDILAGSSGGGMLAAETAAAKLLTKLRALAGLGVISVEVLLFEHFIQKYGLKNTLHAGINPTASLGKDVATDQTVTVNGKTYPIGTAAAYAALKKAGAKLPPIGQVTARQEIIAAEKLGGKASIQPPPASHRDHQRGGFPKGKEPPPIPSTSTSTAKKPTFALPFPLQLALAKAQSTAGVADDERVLRQIRAFIESKIPTLHGQRLLDAYTQLGQVNSQLASDVKSAAKKAKTAAKNFTEPLKLQIELAKAAAFGTPQTKILEAEKAAALKALKSGKFRGQALIDLYNQIASINDQLKNQTTSALGGFKQASTKALTAGLGLSEAQRKALRARLSQLGPNGTVPNQGVGAYGYQIGSNDRPIVIHHTTKLDGKVVERSTARHRQRRERRNPTQRRGPNAATSSA